MSNEKVSQKVAIRFEALLASLQSCHPRFQERPPVQSQQLHHQETWVWRSLWPWPLPWAVPQDNDHGQELVPMGTHMDIQFYTVERSVYISTYTHVSTYLYIYINIYIYIYIYHIITYVATVPVVIITTKS